ncbi:MAG TPA: AI-2E family transporter [Acidimicrobiales bacterium]
MALPRERLYISPRSAVLAVAMLGATLGGLAVLAASRRVIGWILVAATLAGLLHPIVSFLQRRMRRGLAVLLVMLTLVGTAAIVIYGLVDDVRAQTRRLQEVAPERAEELERSPRFGEIARDLHVAERTRRFLDQLPERLRGGSTADAIRAAATRGVAFLATGVLTIFFLQHGPRIAAAAVRQFSDPGRRRRLRELGPIVYARAFGYATATLTMALAAGLFAFAMARAAGVPGPAALGIWVGLWDLVPLGGALVGAMPIVALAAVTSAGDAAWLAAAFVAYQLAENFLVESRVEEQTVHVGPFLTLAAGLVGLELAGVPGALLSVLAVTIAVAIGDEVAPA